jgi:predicted outer membrane protein
MANCLLAQNEAEVQLTELAQQQAQNSSVKEFAQKMAQDHRQMIQQLQQIAGAQSSRSSSLGASRLGTSSATETTTAGTTGTSGTATTSNDTTRTGTCGLGPAGTRGSETSTTPGAATSNQSGRNSLSSSQTTDLAGGVASSAAGGAVQQLGQLEQQILDRKMQLTKEDLQQKQGAEFDKCFVGIAIPAHVHMVAELEVLEKQGGQLAQIAQQARPIAQQHLDQAKQLIKQLEGQSTAAGSQAERKSSTRTE